MTAPPFVLEEQLSHPVLLIDKEDLIGRVLCEALIESLRVVYLSKEHPVSPRCLPIPYHKTLPKIPDSQFSAIIVVYHGETDLYQFLPELSEKARECRVPLLFIVDIYTLTSSLYEKLLVIPNLQVVVVGDLLLTASSSRPEELLKQAKTYMKIHLWDMGLSSLFLTPIDSLLTHVLTLAFSRQTTETVCLFMKNPTTELSFARSIVRIYPEIKLNFSAKKQTHSFSFVPSSALFLSYEPSLVSNWIKEYVVTTPVKKHKSRKNFRPSFGAVSLFLLLFLLLSPLLLFVGAAGGGKWYLEQSVKQLRAGQLDTAFETSKTAGNLFVFAESEIKLFSFLEPVWVVGKGVQMTKEKVSLGKQVAEAVSSVSHAGGLIEKGIAKGDKDFFIDGINEAGESLITIQRLLVSEMLPPDIKKLLMPYEDTIHYFSILKEALPTLFGFEGEKTYVLLFQNNTELRPGGGFIGSFVVMKVDKGAVKEMKTYDVYDADGQLKGHIEPPFFLSRYLGASHWYLRDSNTSIDFSENAIQSMEFLKEEIGLSADSVIGVNAEVLKLLLEKTGPMSIDTYKEQLTSDNVIQLTQDKAEKGFFPGSTQKKDFLSSFQKTLLTASQQDPKILLSLVQAISEASRQKHIQYFTTDSHIQDLFHTAQLSGAIPRSSEGEISDLFGVSEANVGQNKVNQYVERRFDQQVKLSEKGEIAESVTVTYLNTSSKTSSYGGDYTSYLRFLIPKDSTLDSLLIDGVEQQIVPAITDKSKYTRANFIPPKELELEKVEKGELQLLGLPFVVPIGTTKKITISYTRVLPVWGEEVVYTRHLIKQSGTTRDPYSISITIPKNYLIKHSILDQGQQIGQEVITKGYLKQDVPLTLQLIKKTEE